MFHKLIKNNHLFIFIQRLRYLNIHLNNELNLSDFEYFKNLLLDDQGLNFY